MSSLTTDPQEVRRFYDQQVLEHSKMPAVLGCRSQLTADYRMQREWQLFRKLVPLNKGIHFLELGCGGGRWAEKIAPQISEFTGIDFSANAIAHARKNALRKGIKNIQYHLADIQEFEPNGRYDIIYFSSVLIYISQKEFANVIEKYSRHLCEKGQLLIRDSLSDRTHCLEHPGYSAIYRSFVEYNKALQGLHFQLLDRVEISRPLKHLRLWDSRFVNRIYRWAKHWHISSPFFFVIWLLSEGVQTRKRQTADPSYSHDLLIFMKK